MTQADNPNTVNLVDLETHLNLMLAIRELVWTSVASDSKIASSVLKFSPKYLLYSAGVLKLVAIEPKKIGDIFTLFIKRGVKLKKAKMIEAITQMIPAIKNAKDTTVKSPVRPTKSFMGAITKPIRTPWSVNKPTALRSA